MAAAGFKIGLNHYLRANDPILEAKHFLSGVSLAICAKVSLRKVD